MKLEIPKWIVLSIMACVVFSCNTIDNNKKTQTVSKFDKQVDSLLSIMTLEEKIGQMNQYNGSWDFTGPAPSGDNQIKYKHLKEGLVGSMLNVRGVDNVRAVQKIAVEKSRLGIPLLIGFDVIHGYKTLSPIPLAESASWDMQAIELSARFAAVEASAEGINWTFAPMVDISRDARWGRVMEGGGEDTYLASLIAKARVKGFQGDDLSQPNTIAACAKHFAAYGFAEAGRDYNTVDVSMATLHNVILPPFKAASEAGVKTFMNAFNELNGIPATANSYLQRDILKNDWGFEGFVVSDWGSIREMEQHGYAKNLEHATELAIKGGSDMDMESAGYVNYLVGLVKNGRVSENLINDAARRILRLKFELGLFDDPYLYCNKQRQNDVVGNQDVHDAYLDMAKKAIVLLKNEKQLLPLAKAGLDIAVIGSLANDKTSPLGSWRLASKDSTAVSVLEGLSKYPENKITYVSGPKLFKGQPTFFHEIGINTTDRSGFEEAVNAAIGKDVVLLVLGEHGFQSGEARSRTDLSLPGLQQALMEAIYSVNKNVVLVLMNGRPLTIEWADKHIPSILETWQLGSQSGNAIAQVLYGDYNPSGKLPITFPRHVGQVPIYYNKKNTGRPSPTDGDDDMVFWSHYSDLTNEPLYVFGHGLSYTTFKYQNLKLSSKTFSKNNSLEVSFTLTNTGKRRGREVVQMYIQDLVGSLTRPIKELKGFQLVTLNPGESKVITFTVNENTVQFYTANKKWEAELGDFKVFIGGSSKTVLEEDFSFKE